MLKKGKVLKIGSGRARELKPFFIQFKSNSSHGFLGENMIIRTSNRIIPLC